MKKTIVAILLALFASTATAQVDDYRPPGGGGSGSAAGITVGMTDVVGTCVFSGQAGVLYKDPSTGKVQCSANFVFDPTAQSLTVGKQFISPTLTATASTAQYGFADGSGFFQDTLSSSSNPPSISAPGVPFGPNPVLTPKTVFAVSQFTNDNTHEGGITIFPDGVNLSNPSLEIYCQTINSGSDIQSVDNACYALMFNGDLLFGTEESKALRFFTSNAENWNITAAGNLISVGAGRDVQNSGVLKPGTDATALTDAAGKVLAARVNNLAESQVTNLVSDLAGKSPAFADSAGLAALLSDETGSGGGFVRAASPTITTPTIGSFTNAQHDHSNAAGGGNIPESSVTNLVSDLAAKASSGQDYLTFGGVSFSTLISGASVAGSYKPTVAVTLTRISGQIMVQGSCSGGCTTTDHTLRVTDGTTNSDCTNASAVACDAAVGTKFTCTPSNTSRAADQHLAVEALPTSSACTTPPIFAITAEARH